MARGQTLARPNLRMANVIARNPPIAAVVAGAVMVGDRDILQQSHHIRTGTCRPKFRRASGHRARGRAIEKPFNSAVSPASNSTSLASTAPCQSCAGSITGQGGQSAPEPRDQQRIAPPDLIGTRRPERPRRPLPKHSAPARTAKAAPPPKRFPKPHPAHAAPRPRRYPASPPAPPAPASRRR